MSSLRKHIPQKSDDINSILPLVIFLLFLLKSALPVYAQHIPKGIKPGDRIRVSALELPYDNMDAVVSNIFADHIQIVGINAVSWDIPWYQIDRMYVKREKRNTLKGAAIGLGIGAAFGGFIGLVSYKECVSEELFDCIGAPDNRGVSAAFGAALGAIPGVIIGTISGALTKTTRWERVKFGLAVSPSTPFKSPDRFALNTTVSFRITIGK